MAERILIDNIKDENVSFYDALDEFPFVDASNSFESENPLTISKSSSVPDPDDKSTTVSVQSKETPESPSPPSSAGLRRRRLGSHRSLKEYSRSQFVKNNPDGSVDFDPHCSTVSPGKSYKFSLNLKHNEKSNDKLNLTRVHVSSGSVGKKLNEETSVNSTLTTANEDERINDESSSTAADSPNSGLNFLITLAGLVIKAIGFQTNLAISFITFPLLLMHSSYMFMIDPFGVMSRWKNHMLGNITRISRFCYGSVKWIIYSCIRKNESSWKLCLRMGWGLLWSAYVGFILFGLLVSAFVVSGIMMTCVLEKPIQMKEQLNFDYTRDSPVAFVPISSCSSHSCMECNEKAKLWSSGGSQIIPLDHKLQATVSLTLPESDYNRNLGVFQVRVDFLSSNGKTIASTSQPCMLQFKSQPIRLLLTFFKIAPLITGYSSESQTLDIKFKGYTKGDVSTSCLRVVMEQRAEFAKGGGVPEIYTASLKLESQPPFLKRILWYWKGTIFVWISILMFIFELLFTLICCTPVIVPWLRPRSFSSNDTRPGT